jgi:hypothetical protein
MQTMNVINNLQAYANELGYVNANRRFKEYMRKLITFKSDGMMYEHNPKTGDFKPGPDYIKVEDRGFAKPGHILYAQKALGEELNKISRKPNQRFWNNVNARVVRKINSTIKSTLLSVSVFHHIAGLRSMFFGVKGTHLNGIKAYKAGLKRLDEQTGFKSEDYKDLGPIADLLIKEGLTIGRTQDWDDIQQQESMTEDFLKKKTGKLAHKTLRAVKAIRRKKQGFTTSLFSRLFAGLKIEAGAYELEHALTQIEKDNVKAGRPKPATDAQIKLAAQQVATIINADFGGLHLQRMGRNPNFQKTLQLLLLAPDWTESNWRTVTGMVPGVNNWINRRIGDNPEVPGMGKIYRKFWGGIALKSALSIGLLQGAILAMATDDEREDYFDFLFTQLSTREKIAKGRWASLDFTPLARKIGIGDPDKRQVFNVLGHFKDILKVFDVFSLVKHKGSPLVKAAESFATMSDWKDSEFKGLTEMMSTGDFALVDDKFSFGKKPGDTISRFDQVVPWLAYNLRGATPIAASEVIKGVTGESTWMVSAAKAFGLDVQDVTHKPAAQTRFEEIVKDVNEKERNLKTAKTLKDREGIREAKAEIREDRSFNKTKARIGFTRTQLAFWNRKEKPLKLKEKEGVELSDKEAKQLRTIRAKKRQIYERAVKLIDK